jgi:RND family efflux transporter MFP subunit
MPNLMNARRPARDRGPLLSALFLLVTGVAGCNSNLANDKPPGPPNVTVAHPVSKEVVEWDIFTGHLQAPEAANVAARVSGMIMEMPFAEGSVVKRGALLAVIDDRPFKADLDAKLADHQRAESALAIAKLTLDRQTALRKTNAVSQQDLDNAKAVAEQAAAAVAGAKAAVDIARLNLEWCRVLSPIDGRVSNKLVTVGNLVNGGAGQATLLTTVQSVSPVYCYVDIDEQSVLKYQKLAEERKLLSARDGKVPCYVELGNETGFPHEGVIDFMDNHVDPSTGTMRFRGVLENRSGRLVPGLFARLRVPGSGRYPTLLVPDTAVGNDQDQHTVYVVDKDNKVQVRPVVLGALFGGLRSITKGIGADDRVVVNGQMHVRPGAAVTPVDAPIKLEQGEFSDPGTNVAGRDPSHDAKGSAAPTVEDRAIVRRPEREAQVLTLSRSHTLTLSPSPAAGARE